MPDAFELHEARFVQSTYSSGGLAATTVGTAQVPAGKVWTIRFASYYPDIAETKIIWFYVVARSTILYAITRPVSIALSSTAQFPMLENGMELKLYPGESLGVRRDSATAGSTMLIYFCYIESDLPYYAYEEPQNKTVQKYRQHGSAYRSSGALSTGSPGSGSQGPSGGGGGHSGEPI